MHNAYRLLPYYSLSSGDFTYEFNKVKHTGVYIELVELKYSDTNGICGCSLKNP